MATTLNAREIEISPMEGFPSDERGYEQGVSACYAGCLGDILIMAGGANFANKPAAEGGKKCFYSGIYAAKITSSDDLSWKKIGELPMAMAYGATVTLNNKIILIGGACAQGSLSAVFSLELVNDRIVVEQLPSLPVALDNLSATVYENKIYAAGGSSNGKEHNEVYVLDTKKENPQWERYKPYKTIPHRNRIGLQTVAVAPKGKVLILGGYSPNEDSYSAEVYNGPSGGALAQTPDGKIYVAGGVNHEIFLDALSGSYEKVAQEDYLKQPVEWYRFDGRLQLFNPQDYSYTTLAESPHLARAGASLVAYKDMLFSIGGEIKPGIRSPLIVRIKL